MLTSLLCVAAANGGTPGESNAILERLERESIVLQAAEVQTGDGTTFKPGVVIVLDGKIVAVGPAPPLPAGSRQVDCGDAVITPGLVDAACQLGAFQKEFAEQASEVIPQLDAADAIDLYSKELEQLAREGVTTIYVTGDASSVISCKGAAVKTAGPVAERRLAAKPAVKATLGPESSRRGGFNFPPSRFGASIYARRPTTRMGSAWVFREAFLQARAFKEGRPSRQDPDASRALLDVLDGKIALRMQAREALDFFSAARLCDEFQVPFSIEYGIEAGKAIDLLAERKVPVFFGPMRIETSDASTYEDSRAVLSTPKLLAERGVPFCLTACDEIGERGLARQAGIAIRNGLPRERALRAVTTDAAAMLGLEKRVGRLAEGLDADLVVWNGSPFDDAAKPVLVLIGGRAVHDPGRRLAKEDS